MSRTFSYDAEGRQTSATINGQTTTYAYDGDGKRVQKVAPAGSSVYVYDALGQLAAEYSTAPATDSGTSYLVADQLGSTRLITDTSGATKKAYDYLPFGEELLAGTGARTTAMGFNDSASVGLPDIQTIKFWRNGKRQRDRFGLLDYSILFRASGPRYQS